MKKLLLAIIIAAAFTSCKKEYTCSCTRTLSDGTPNGTSTYQVDDKQRCGADGQSVRVDAAGITHNCKIQ
jgi:hypothetical protein